ncbi:hypothetical protein [Eremococcus coleocola]|uniref:hypothetical protein n=1 Tax=Eremococcus coleocola TaxID=88132 RepID=UPI000424FD9B|nr:hypothetical protein [Eremococcus coleocola]
MVTELEENGASPREMLIAIREQMAGVHLIVDKDDTTIVAINQTDLSYVDNVLRIRWKGYEFFSGDLNNQSSVYAGVEYELVE